MLDHISWSQINMWMRCPRQWYYRYVLEIKFPPAGALVLGGSYHSALATSFRQKKGTRVDPPVPDWLDAFSTVWDEYLCNEAEIDWEGQKPGDLKDIGIALVGAYAKEVAPLVMPLAIEKPYVRRINGVPLAGVVDLEDEDFVTMEHKTSNRAYSQDQVDRDGQLTTYGFLTDKPIDGEFHIAVKPTTTLPARIQIVKTTRTVEQILWWVKGIEQILMQMKAGVAPPNPGGWWCSERFCGYFHMCQQELTKEYSIGGGISEK